MSEVAAARMLANIHWNGPWSVKGRTVRAVALLRGPVCNGQRWPAVQLNR